MFANYMFIKRVLYLTCQTVAYKIKEKNSKKIREIFNIKNNLTPKERKSLERENT